jgi:hypothetical protein
MAHLRQLIESRPFFSRVPDQLLLASEAGQGTDHVQATLGEGYLFVYSASGQPFTLNMARFRVLKSRVTGTALVTARKFPSAHSPTGQRARSRRPATDAITTGFGAGRYVAQVCAPGKRGNVLPVVKLDVPQQSLTLQARPA